MRDLEIGFEQVKVSPEEGRLRLNKAFEILFSGIVKDGDLRSSIPQNLIPAKEVDTNDIQKNRTSASMGL